MDTRSKIVPLHELPERLQNRAQWVSGHFDPLLAEHVRQLQQARQWDNPLVVEITNPPQPLLSQRARAELVAALSIVDYVVFGNGATAPDAEVTDRFIHHVLQRHRQEQKR